jgi:hypothetical protein
MSALMNTESDTVTESPPEDPTRSIDYIHAQITDRLGIDCAEDPDPLIDLGDIAALAGLAKITPAQWRQRTKAGTARVPFPDPAPGVGLRFADKPMWRAVSQVLPYLIATENWPPENGARTMNRGPRSERTIGPKDKVTVQRLEVGRSDLAAKLKAKGLDDGKARTTRQWLYRLKKSTANA